MFLKKISQTALLHLIAVLAIGLTGCTKVEPTTGGSDKAGSGADKKLTIALIPKGTGYAFWETVEEGGSGHPETAEAYELFVIGALIIGTLYKGSQMADWREWQQLMAIGGIIIIASAIDQVRHRRRT